MNSSVSDSQRYEFVDALRGIAALGVFLNHFYFATVMQKTFDTFTPTGLRHLLSFGSLGVPIFFVLSGFVIAHSLRNNTLSAASVGQFILRRQIRLDPAYWFLIAFTLLLLAIENALPGLYASPLPPVSAVILNFFYLHRLAGLPDQQHIVGVAWTLCLEVQFYLLFILLLVAGKKGPRLRAENSFTSWSVALIGISGAFCLALKLFHAQGAWFYSFWHYFAAGVLSYLAWQRLLAPRWFYIFSALFVMSAILSPLQAISHAVTLSGMLAGITTALLLYASGVAGVISSWGGGAMLQYFGRISYSLYLIHLPVLSVILRVGFKISGDNRPLSLVWGALALAASIGAAHLLHRFIELPSMNLAARFKTARGQSAVSGFANPAPASEVS